MRDEASPTAARVLIAEDHALVREGIRMMLTGEPGIEVIAEAKRALWAQLEANADATLERHCELWEEERGVRVSVATMSRAVRKLGWTFKKSRWWPPSETRGREVLGERA